MDKEFAEFATQCQWLGCDEVWNGERNSKFWFCNHAINLDGACHPKNCPLLGEENDFKNKPT